MTDANRLGSAVGKLQVTDQAIGLAARWLPTFLAEAERVHGITPGTVERPRDYDAPAELAKFPELQVPTILAVTAGLDAPPERRGDGGYVGHWGITYTAIVHGPTERATKMQESVYGVAIRLMGLRQLGELGRVDTGSDPWNLDLSGVAGDLRDTPLFVVRSFSYDDEGYSGTPVPRRKSLLGPSIPFTVSIAGHAYDGLPLTAPDPDPLGDPGPYPAAAEVDVTLNSKAFSTNG